MSDKRTRTALFLRMDGGYESIDPAEMGKRYVEKATDLALFCRDALLPELNDFVGGNLAVGQMVGYSLIELGVLRMRSLGMSAKVMRENLKRIMDDLELDWEAKASPGTKAN